MLLLLSPTRGYRMGFPAMSVTGSPAASTASPKSTSPVPPTAFVPVFSTSRLAA